MNQVEDAWEELPTTTHQDHVIAHVIGATVLAFIVLDDAIHLLLDIEFIWKIYVDGEMGLLPRPVAAAEFEVTEELRSEIKAEIDLVLREAASASLVRFSLLTKAGPITAVDLLSAKDELKVLIEGETGSMEIRTSLSDHEFQVTET